MDSGRFWGVAALPGIFPPGTFLSVTPLDSAATKKGGYTPLSSLRLLPNHPASHRVAHRARRDARQDVRHVMVPAPDRRNAHAQRQGQQRPEQPTPVPPRTPQRRHRSGHVLRRKGRAAHAAKMLDKIDRRGKWSALQICVPHSRHREPRAFDRKKHRDQIADRVARGGVRHRGPILFPIAPVVQNSDDDEQIREVGDVCELKKIVPRRRGKLFEPQRRMHSRQPKIERDQLRILPAGIDEVHEFSKLFKTKQKKQVRIPVPPEMPAARGQRFAAQKGAFLAPRRRAAQRKNQGGNRGLRRHKPRRMREVSREDRDQHSRKCQIAERDPFKCAACLPHIGRFTLKNSGQVLQRGFSWRALRPGQNRFIGIETVLLLHRALSGTIFGNFVFGRAACSHRRISQRRRSAAFRSPASGFTAAGMPTLASIHSSIAPSPYALHSARFNFHFSAYHHTAIAFASPNIGRPSTRPVQRPHFSSSRVAQTWISAARFRFANSPRRRAAISSARNSSVPVTSTMRSPVAAWRAMRSIASGKKSASSPARFARRPVERIPRRYALFPCSAHARPFGARRANSASHARPLRKVIFPSCRSARKYLRSSEGFSVSVPSTSKNAAWFMRLLSRCSVCVVRPTSRAPGISSLPLERA